MQRPFKKIRCFNKTSVVFVRFSSIFIKKILHASKSQKESKKYFLFFLKFIQLIALVVGTIEGFYEKF